MQDHILGSEKIAGPQSSILSAISRGALWYSNGKVTKPHEVFVIGVTLCLSWCHCVYLSASNITLMETTQTDWRISDWILAR